ncbi:hypothetical protein GMDG_08258, partial [Pseudogymnoascus destructans 20631-21]
ELSTLTRVPSDWGDRVDEARREADHLECEVRAARARKRATVESRIAELEVQEQRKRALQRELRELRKEWTPTRDRKWRASNGHDGYDQGGASLEIGSVASESAASHPRGPHRAPKFRDLATFQGKSLREAQVFAAGADRRFRIDARSQYPTDQNKIDYCVLAFGPTPAAKWERHERREGLGNTTWAEFKEWIMDSIIDPSNRTFDAITSYNEAKQGETQSAEDFAAHLDTLELELQIEDEELRKNTLYAKLREEVRREILHSDQTPPSYGKGRATRPPGSNRLRTGTGPTPANGGRNTT